VGSFAARSRRTAAAPSASPRAGAAPSPPIAAREASAMSRRDRPRERARRRLLLRHRGTRVSPTAEAARFMGRYARRPATAAPASRASIPATTRAPGCRPTAIASSRSSSRAMTRYRFFRTVSPSASAGARSL
jgi:hypothetical protein